MLSQPTVLAEYLFKLADAETTAWKEKGVAVAAYTVAVLSMFHLDDTVDWTDLCQCWLSTRNGLFGWPMLSVSSS